MLNILEHILDNQLAISVHEHVLSFVVIVVVSMLMKIILVLLIIVNLFVAFFQLKQLDFFVYLLDLNNNQIFVVNVFHINLEQLYSPGIVKKNKIKLKHGEKQ
jgi:hypothetical protein